MEKKEENNLMWPSLQGRRTRKDLMVSKVITTRSGLKFSDTFTLEHLELEEQVIN